jgi:hypothetical protein
MRTSTISRIIALEIIAMTVASSSHAPYPVALGQFAGPIPDSRNETIYRPVWCPGEPRECCDLGNGERVCS